VSRIAWEAVTPAPEPRGEAQGAAVGGRLYVFGGFTSGATLDTTARSDAYDAAGGSWQRVPDMPVAVTHAPVVVDGTTIWLLGGYVGDHPGPATAQVWKYDVAAARWSAGPPLPAARGAGGAAIVGRELHFFGGTSRNGSNGDPDEGEHWVLGLDGGTTWQPRAPLPNPRNHLAGVGLGGLVYAIGGQYGENETTGNQSQVDAYDPASDTWRPRAPLPAPRGHVSSSAVVVGDRIVVMGGTEQGNKASSAVEVYNSATNAWTSMTSLPDTRKTPVAGLLGADLYVATGSFRTATLRGRLLP
jgi:N-acetylneuraminic acid mutarotase